MTDEQVLQICIERAMKNGFSFEGLLGFHSPLPGPHKYFDWGVRVDNDYDLETHYEEIIFDHAFCKALFGEEVVCATCGLPIGDYKVFHDEGDENRLHDDCYDDYYYWVQETAWKHHIQQLALAENRIDYLRNYLAK